VGLRVVSAVGGLAAVVGATAATREAAGGPTAAGEEAGFRVSLEAARLVTDLLAVWEGVGAVSSSSSSSSSESEESSSQATSSSSVGADAASKLLARYLLHIPKKSPMLYNDR
jgi:hypothetical protein